MWQPIPEFVIAMHLQRNTWYVGRNFCGYLILRIFPNRKNSQNIVPANNSNNKVLGSEKKMKGGYGASLHFAMFDSARVRGVEISHLRIRWTHCVPRDLEVITTTHCTLSVLPRLLMCPTKHALLGWLCLFDVDHKHANVNGVSHNENCRCFWRCFAFFILGYTQKSVWM